MNYSLMIEEIDNINNIEQLENIEKELQDGNILRKYWAQRAIALTSESELERKRARIKCNLYQKMYGASIPVNRSVNKFVAPHGLTGIHISGGAKLGTGCTIFQHVVIGSNTLLDSKNHGFPVIGNNVYIGAGAMVIGNTKIGNNVRIGANCIVTKDVPDNSICVMSGSKTIVKEAPMDNTFLSIKKYVACLKANKEV